MRNLDTKNCEYCAESYYQPYNCSTKNWIKSRFCSWNCRLKWVTKNNTGSNHWQWQGGKDTEKHRRVIYETQRKERKRANGGYHSEEEWETLKAQYNWTCPACKLPEPIIELTHDHIIAVSKGGSNNIENIQPLCLSCNCKKKTKNIRYSITN